MPAQCKATNRRGEPCSAPVLSGREYCFWHDPGLAKERAAARRKAGRNRARGRSSPGFAEEMQGRQFRTLDDMIALLELAIRQTLQLINSTTRNRALGYLARVWADLHQAGELEARLEALEQRLTEAGK